jgi:hypothetical protein
MSTSPAHRYPAQQRAEWVVDIHAAAADRRPHAAYAQALADYWTAAAPGDDSREPRAGAGVSWPVECALSADFSAIHSAPLAPGFHGGDYAREYIRLRTEASRRARVAALRREQNAEAARQRAASALGSLLSLDPDTEPTED